MTTRPRPAGMTPAQLRALMKRAGIRKQCELAALLSVGDPLVSTWLSGKRDITKGFAARILLAVQELTGSPVTPALTTPRTA